MEIPAQPMLGMPEVSVMLGERDLLIRRLEIHIANLEAALANAQAKPEPEPATA